MKYSNPGPFRNWFSKNLLNLHSLWSNKNSRISALFPALLSCFQKQQFFTNFYRQFNSKHFIVESRLSSIIQKNFNADIFLPKYKFAPSSSKIEVESFLELPFCTSVLILCVFFQQLIIFVVSHACKLEERLKSFDYNQRALEEMSSLFFLFRLQCA